MITKNKKEIDKMKTTRRVSVKAKNKKTEDNKNIPGFNSKIPNSYFNKKQKR